MKPFIALNNRFNHQALTSAVLYSNALCSSMQSRTKDLNEPFNSPDQPIQTFGLNANGVELQIPPLRSWVTDINANGVRLQSPVSRSARWVTDHP